MSFLRLDKAHLLFSPRSYRATKATCLCLTVNIKPQPLISFLDAVSTEPYQILRDQADLVTLCKRCRLSEKKG